MARSAGKAADGRTARSVVLEAEVVLGIVPPSVTVLKSEIADVWIGPYSGALSRYAPRAILMMRKVVWDEVMLP